MNRKRTAWFGQLPLAHRILAVNLLTIVLLACGVLYLDAFRNQLSEERVNLIRREAKMSADVLAKTPTQSRPAILETLARASDSRVRVYGADGVRILDSWQLTGPTYRLRNPAEQRWQKDAARSVDRSIRTHFRRSPRRAPATVCRRSAATAFRFSAARPGPRPR